MRLTTISALALGILLGVCGTMALYVAKPGPGAGDWLAFAGALVGVTLTILGTLWLEDYRASRGEREDEKVVVSSLDEIRAALAAGNDTRGDGDAATAKARWIAKEQALVTAFDNFLYARHFAPKRNIKAWRSLEQLNSTLEVERREVTNELRILEDDGDHDGVLNVSISKMQQLHERLDRKVEAARKLLD